MADTPISSLTVFVGTLPTGTYLEIATPDNTSSTGYSSYRATADQISATVVGYVPTTRAVNAGIGLNGGGTLATDITLNFSVADLTLKSSAMTTADSFAIDDVGGGSVPARITFANAMKALTGLPALGAPDLTNDYLVINRASDGGTYKVNPSSISLAAGNMPAGGTSGQILTKASNANYDTTWTSGGFINQAANVVFSGPVSGGAAQPTFRALVGADLPDPAASTKGGVKSYVAVSNQFLTSIATDGTPVSAQPSFSNISGTATVAQGGTGAVSFTAHGILLGEGTSAVAVTSAMTDGQLLVGQTGADPLPKSVSGDITISALGVTAIGANKVTDAMLRQSAGLSLIGRSASTTGNVADITGTANQVMRVAAAGASVGFGSIDLSAAAVVGASVLPVANGGTNIASYAVGDILYASGATALSKLADVATGNALISGGVTTAPAWGKIGLATHVSGTLPIANGGTAGTTATAGFDNLSPTTTRGDLVYRNATVNARLPIGSTNTVLRTDGTDPIWGSVVLSSDVTGTLPVPNGGTGTSAFNANGAIFGNGTSALQVTIAGTTGQVLAATTSAAPSFQSISAVLDNLGATQGQLLYRNATVWTVLPVGTDGQVLATQGAGANPHWLDVAGTGTVTSVNGSGGTTGLTLTGGAITTAGTLTLGGTLIAANGGTGQSSYAQGDILYASGSTTLSKLAKDTNATRYISNTGTSNNPAWSALPSATTSTAGIAETATDAEYIAQSSTTVVLTPSNLAARPMFYATKTGSDQTLTAGTSQYTKITFPIGGVSFNVGGYYDPSTSLFTPPAGSYYISAKIYFSTVGATSGEGLGVVIRKNGADARPIWVHRIGTPGQSWEISDILQANGTDTFEVDSWAANGSLLAQGTVDYCSFSAFKL